MHRVDNMLVNSITLIPRYQGIPLGYYPKLNNGKMENSGYEIEARYNKQITQDWSVIAGAGFTHSRNKVIKINEQPLGDDYQYKCRTEGYKYGQPWGYLINYSNGNGMFNSKEELTNSGLTYDFGAPRAGDFIYQDLNGDDVINQKDAAPIGNSWYPDIYYQMSGGFAYKGLEFNFLFQGVSRNSFYMNGTGVFEYVGEGVFNDIHKNAWTSDRYRFGEKIDYPALSLSPSTNHQQNDFFIVDASYLRLRNVEIAYTLPAGISKKMAVNGIRFSLNAQNLLTFDRLKSKYIDPETANMSYFQPYRAFNLGVNINF